MNPDRRVISAVLLLALGCARAGGSPAANMDQRAPVSVAPSTVMDENPLLRASTLPYGAPPFDRIRDSHYKPALEEGMRQQLAEVGAIAAQGAGPTFDNTMVAMERTGALLTRAGNVFGAVVQANTNDVLQQVQTELAPRFAAHTDAIYLNDALYQRVRSLYDRRAALGLTPEQTALLERYHRDFVRAGARLSEGDKGRLRALNQEESRLSTEFRNRLLAATKAGAVVLDDRAQLAGLSDGEIAAAAEAGQQRGLAGKYVIVLQNTTQQPAMASLRNRAVRQRLFEASTRRAELGDSNDTRAVIQRLAQLRAERAALLGFPTYAAYALDHLMARTPEAATGLLAGLAPAATARARGEGARMQRLIDEQKGGFKLAPWDWQFYAEQVRKAEYDLDAAQIRPYFELDRVLREGVFFAAEQLYGLTFRERPDIPVYHPDVRVFEVFEADGKSIALFYADFFKRDNKSGGAWMANFVDQSGLLGLRPVVYNVSNFAKPVAGQPALLTFDEVRTMFHEFGHALHGLFSNAMYPTIAGTNVSRDFVEFPSQFNEHWALEPSVFARYAKHHETGAAMPQALVDRIRKAATFNQGYATTEYLGAALLDLAWHSLPPGTALQNVGTFERDALARVKVNVPEVPPRYRTPYFAHIWGGGYSAAYYAYMWSEVLDADTYAWFTEHGGMTRANGQRFRDLVLSRGSTANEGALFRSFRGRDPQIEPLLRQRGLKDAVGGER